MPLTARQIEQAKPKEKSYKLTDGAGFYLYIAPTGLKSWRKNYTRAGKQKTAPIGRWPRRLWRRCCSLDIEEWR